MVEFKIGSPTPLGISFKKNGINFALFSKYAEKAYLCFFHETEKSPFQEILLNRSGDIWHIEAEAVPEKAFYAYRLEGPYAPQEGHLFNKDMYLIDPYAKEILSPKHWGNRLRPKNPEFPPRASIFHSTPFEWEGDAPLQIPFEELIIYELHVRGFTMHPSSNTKLPGTYWGVIEKIPHLKQLGINAVELMPVFEFDECENPHINPITHQPLFNYWGYSPTNFFTPMQRYAHGNAIMEFKEMVKQLHKNGIEVILDVVFNHTSEGNVKDHYISFRGIDNKTYYLIDKNGEYLNFTGCGNTFNCNHPAVANLILDAMHYWIKEMHVDGFRFDLASILTRDEQGHPMESPPVIEMISNDPICEKIKLIAEPWDPGGLYQVQTFPSWGRWAEWNGKYRDTVRIFLKGTDGMAGAFAQRICGSEDLYGKYKTPFSSINFITAHDGFTLRDLVTYQQKHNESNGEQNRDGSNYNANWNCGEEGPTTNKKINQLRERQIKNHMVALMVSLGTPMILMGDEYAHTRMGNNNTYCHDNELNWFLWDELEKDNHFFIFLQKLIAFRKKHIRFSSFLTSEDVKWHTGWDVHNKFVAYTLKDYLFIAFNAFETTKTITLPSKKKWYRIIDTFLDPPNDFQDNPQEIQLGLRYSMAPYSAFIAMTSLGFRS